MKKRTSLAAALVTVLATAGCSGSDEPSPAERSGQPAASRAVTDVACPDVDAEKEQVVRFRAADPGSPRLVADLLVDDLGGGDFCVVPESYDSPAVAGRIVSYGIVLPDGSDYGERYGTFARRPSEELLNFPFDFHVYGACQDLIATIRVRDGGATYPYRARSTAGPRCPV